MAHLVVASYNLHGGVDGWGRPFDVVDACRQLDADVMALQECWVPDGGAGLAQVVAEALGYSLTELAYGRGRIFAPPNDPGTQWGPPFWENRAYGLRLYRRRTPPQGYDRADRIGRGRGVQRGTTGIAVLTRVPVIDTKVIDLGQLPQDPARRGAIAVDVDVNGERVRVAGTHMAHLSQGSLIHLARLRRALRERPQELPAVLAGDMNMWGPPLSMLLPGWSRAVRGRSWPTWSRVPIAQPDHILVSGPVQAPRGLVVEVGASDHLSVRAELVIA
jgi:endonuclease/exonuclease/phosphatase family metal-dependent hydrolase